MGVCHSLRGHPPYKSCPLAVDEHAEDSLGGSHTLGLRFVLLGCCLFGWERKKRASEASG